MKTHPYRKGPRLDSYAPTLPTKGLVHRDNRPLLPKGWLRITKAEHAAYEAVWAEYDATGAWVPKSSSGRPQ